MTDLRNAAQQALDALYRLVDGRLLASETGAAINALRDALARDAQAEPHPTAVEMAQQAAKEQMRQFNQRMVAKLSDRLRPGVECAPWVIDEVRRLEDAAAPVVEPQPVADADASYDMIDRFLRNNLDDADYATFSTALDEVAALRAERDALAKARDTHLAVITKQGTTTSELCEKLHDVKAERDTLAALLREAREDFTSIQAHRHWRKRVDVALGDAAAAVREMKPGEVA